MIKINVYHSVNFLFFLYSLLINLRGFLIPLEIFHRILKMSKRFEDKIQKGTKFELHYRVDFCVFWTREFFICLAFIMNFMRIFFKKVLLA